MERVVVGMILCALLLVGHAVAAEEGPDGEDVGYPHEHDHGYDPTDAEVDLDNSFPKRDSVIGFGVPKEYFDWKKETYDKYGLKLGINYQLLFQHATERSPLASNKSALGHWWGITAKWTPLNRGDAYEGSLVLVAAERGSIGDNAVPAQYGQTDVGSLYPVNFEHTEWDFAIEELYWEQWFEKSLMVRVGNTAAGVMINPFRFKDARTSFTATPFAFHESIPAPAQGPGIAAKWWPIEDSEFYVTGVVNDVDGNPDDGWAGIDLNSVGRGEFFYALEFGHNWKREGGEFDQLYATLFYFDERSTRSPALPNESGGGFKILGSKQMGPWVGFASYTFITDAGGSIGVSFGEHTVTAGGAYLSPLGIRGELSLGMIWMKPFDDLVPGVSLRNQFGLETYWKILLTPNLWVTPGIQYIHQPSLNPGDDNLFIPHIKFRIAF